MYYNHLNTGRPLEAGKWFSKFRSNYLDIDNDPLYPCLLYTSGKAYTPTDQLTPGRTKYGANNNVRIFRYADVLLMNAEAKVRLGKDGDASLKLVRDRAGMSEKMCIRDRLCVVQ